MSVSVQKDLNLSAQAFNGPQVIFCRDCIVFGLRQAKGEFDKMSTPNPAITWQVYMENNMPVAVPVCLGHVYWKENSLSVV